LTVDPLVSGDLRKNLLQEQLDRDDARYEEYENAITKLQQDLEAAQTKLTEILEENKELKTDNTSLTAEVAKLSEVPSLLSYLSCLRL
jgi:peptidoglycan hydrolase CwlO-like protein